MLPYKFFIACLSMFMNLPCATSKECFDSAYDLVGVWSSHNEKVTLQHMGKTHNLFLMSESVHKEIPWPCSFLSNCQPIFLFIYGLQNFSTAHTCTSTGRFEGVLCQQIASAKSTVAKYVFLFSASILFSDVSLRWLCPGFEAASFNWKAYGVKGYLFTNITFCSAIHVQWQI